MLGKRVEDRITGFSGTVTVVADYLDGAQRALVERDGDAEAIWFDQSRLNRIAAEAPKPGA